MVWCFFFLAKWSKFKMKPVYLTRIKSQSRERSNCPKWRLLRRCTLLQNAWNCSRFNVCRVTTNHSMGALITSSMRALTESTFLFKSHFEVWKLITQSQYDSLFVCFFSFFTPGVWPSSPFIHEPAIVSAQPSWGNCVDTHKSQKAHGKP